jgi:hypothetical protein
MAKRILDIDPSTGKVTTYEYDHSEDRHVIQSATDISEVIENNKRLQNDGTAGWNDSREYRRVATIPLSLVELWKQIYGVDPLREENEPLLHRLLNDPDLRFIRTADWQF